MKPSRIGVIFGLCLGLLVTPAAAQNTSPPTERPPHALPVPTPEGALDLRVPSAGVDLAVTVYLPEGQGPFPAVVFAHGANPASRNQPGYRNFLGAVLNAGVAVAVFDPRGVGDTPGQWVEGPPLDQTADDIVAVAVRLAQLPQIKAGKVGVMGGSRGGWTGPMAASRSDAVSFVVASSAPSVTPNDANIHQRGEELRDEGYTDAEVEEINAMRRIVWRYYGTGQGYEEARAVWMGNAGKPWFARMNLRPEPQPPEALSAPGFDYYRGGVYDPMPVLSALRKPILVVLGDADRHIPVEASQVGWRQAFAASGNPDATLVMLAGAGHSLRLVDGKERMSLVEGHATLRQGDPHPAWAPILSSWLRRVTADQAAP